VYDAFLPNSSKEFSSVQMQGGACGLVKTFKIVTPLTPGGFEATKEGEAGLVAEIDSTREQATTEAVAHELTFRCAGSSQEPKKAFDAKAVEVSVDSLESSLGTEKNSLCLEGKATLKLTSGIKFATK
jgi:hypothetical protein